MRGDISIVQLERLVSDEDTCLDILFDLHYTGKVCPKCNYPKYHRVKGRACYECGKCGHQVYPKTNTLMKGTKLPMHLWLLALYFFVQSKNSISSLEMASHLGITPKNARALTKKLQALTKEVGRDKFTGIIEVDVTYIGGKKKAPKDAEKRIGFNGQEHKIKVFGIRERRTGRIRTFIIEAESIAETLPIILANVEIGSTIHSDEAAAYKCLPKYGFKHEFVRHKKFEWKRGNVTIQPLEGFWSYLKRAIRGTHIWISIDFMRCYLDEMEFRYNNCNAGTENTFFILAGRLFNTSPETFRNLFHSRSKP